MSTIRRLPAFPWEPGNLSLITYAFRPRRTRAERIFKRPQLTATPRRNGRICPHDRSRTARRAEPDRSKTVEPPEPRWLRAVGTNGGRVVWVVQNAVDLL